MSKPPSRFSDWRLRLGLWIGYPLVILGTAGTIVAGVECYLTTQAAYRPNAGMAALGTGIAAGMMFVLSIGAAIIALFGAALLFAVNQIANRRQIDSEQES